MYLGCFIPFPVSTSEKAEIWQGHPPVLHRNRRVILLVSGEAIGNPVNAATTSLRPGKRT